MCATDSSRGGRCSYLFSSAPSTDVRAAEVEGGCEIIGRGQDFVSSLYTLEKCSEKNGDERWRRA